MSLLPNPVSVDVLQLTVGSPAAPVTDGGKVGEPDLGALTLKR